MRSLTLSAVLVAAATFASAADTPDLSGVWSPARATGPNAPPAPTPILQKGQYKAERDALRAKIQAASARGEQYATKGLCSVYGMPTMMAVASYPMEILQTPQQVTLIGEAFSEVRRIYIGKKQMALDDIAPGYYGHSVGHWEGDTLVVDTIGIKENVQGYEQMIHSDQMHITERIRKPTPDTLHDQITIDDPVTLEKPFTYTLAYRRLNDYTMVEFVCDNNREYIDENNIVRMRIGPK
jgi:hypothetical protein